LKALSQITQVSAFVTVKRFRTSFQASGTSLVIDTVIWELKASNPQETKLRSKMKNITNTLRAATMLAIIAFGTTFAHAGIIIGGAKAETDPCKQKVDNGIIIGGITGIIIGGLTGIIIGGAIDSKPTEPVDCGIIIGG
jgi:hypothetical protein